MQGSIEISVNELCERIVPSGNIDTRREAFRVVDSKRILNKLQRQTSGVYAPDVALKKHFSENGESIILSASAHGIIQTQSTYVLEEILCVNVPVNSLDEGFCPTHHARAMCKGYMFASEKGIDSVTVRLTYCDIFTEKTVSFDNTYEQEDLELFVRGLLGEYIRLEQLRLERRRSFQKSAKRLSFPYDDYRQGQRRFAEFALEAICTKKKLFAEAPTGIGKTVSALFPAIKASGNGYGEKIFYFTSKTTIAEAAVDAFRLMKDKGLDASCIVITARERLCAASKEVCDPTVCKYACGHYDRINEALLDAIENERIFDRDTIDAYAKAHCVCPYELSLAISEWCELVVCDYNYLFDPIVYLRRYFAQGAGGDYIFLVDEAHNLGERARAMYSHSIKSTDIEQLLLAHNSQDMILYPKLVKLLEYMKSADKLVEIKKRTYGELGFFKSQKPFGILKSKLEELAEAFDSYFRGRREIPQRMTQIYSEIKKYLKIAEYYDDKYVSLIEYRNGEYTFRQLCVDPSELLRKRLALGRCAIFFSATLSPAEYYKNVLGGDENDLVLTLDSPFPKENLCLCTTYRFSTRFDHRSATLSSLCSLLETFIKAKSGNYIAFFPSYKYMKEVYEEFTKRFPWVKTIVQTSGMSDRERDDYIKSFDITQTESAEQKAVPSHADPLAGLLGKDLMRGSAFFEGAGLTQKELSQAPVTEYADTMLAFGVLGSVFAEGVDFAGERLIGCAVVGVGLPGINDDSNIICEYYNSKSDDEYMRGYDYAYRIPGMIKVLQAAGRVIRSESDRGAVLLIDDRYATREYTSMFPSHWKHMKLVGDKDALAELLRRFWNKE